MSDRKLYAFKYFGNDTALDEHYTELGVNRLNRVGDDDHFHTKHSYLSEVEILRRYNRDIRKEMVTNAQVAASKIVRWYRKVGIYDTTYRSARMKAEKELSEICETK